MTTAIAPVLRNRSALEAFACPFRFQQRYLEHVPDESDPARRGTAFHACAKRYIRLLAAAGCTDDLDLARQALLEGLADSMCPAHLLDEVHDLFERWVEVFELQLDALLINEERPPDPDGYRWTPDLVYAAGDVLEVRDFKTYWQLLSQSVARDTFQSKFYAARARKVWPGFQTYRFTFDFVRFLTTVSVEYSQADIDRHEEHVLALEAGIARAIDRNDFPAVPGEWCGFCRLDCPLLEEATLPAVRVDTADEAQLVAGQLLVLDQARKAREGALKNWCAINGPVRIGGMEFAHRPSVRQEFPIGEVMRILTDAGQSPTFTVGKTVLKSYLTTKKHAHLAPQLEAVALSKPSSEFRAKKVGDEAPDQHGAEA